MRTAVGCLARSVAEWKAREETRSFRSGPRVSHRHVSGGVALLVDDAAEAVVPSYLEVYPGHSVGPHIIALGVNLAHHWTGRRLPRLWDGSCTAGSSARP
jgi:hypothetical protein